MLKALGLGKKNLPHMKDDLIKQHKEQSPILQQWENDVGTLKNITKKLRDSYGNHKGDFALGRYEELKNMIKNTVKEFQNHMQEVKSRTNERIMAQAAAKDPGRKGGAIARLRMHAQGFAEKQDEVTKQERNYSEMSSKQLESELDQIRKNILQLKQDFYAERDKLERLAKEYEESKRHNPMERYTVLKTLIKTASLPTKTI